MQYLLRDVVVVTILSSLLDLQLVLQKNVMDNVSTKPCWFFGSIQKESRHTHKNNHQE